MRTPPSILASSSCRRRCSRRRSPSSVHSVTVLAEDGLTTEALSKTVFVLGVEKGMRLIESQPGVDAIVVAANGALHYSSGLLAPQPRVTQ